jgi:phage gp29-like protein
MSGETDAQILAKKVDAILASQERVKLAAEHALLSQKIEEREAELVRLHQERSASAATDWTAKVPIRARLQRGYFTSAT